MVHPDHREEADARLYDAVLWLGRAMFQQLHQRFHQQGCDRQGGELAIHKPLLSFVRSIHPSALPCVIQSTCTQNCVDKFLKHSERVSARFQEQNVGKLSISLGPLHRSTEIDCILSSAAMQAGK